MRSLLVLFYFFTFLVMSIFAFVMLGVLVDLGTLPSGIIGICYWGGAMYLLDSFKNKQ